MGVSFLFCKVTTDSQPIGRQVCYDSRLKGRLEIREAKSFLKLLVWKKIHRDAIANKQKFAKMLSLLRKVSGLVF